MWKRILEIVRKEFRQTLREPRMRGMLLIPPVVQLLVFGYAVNLDVDVARIAWMDSDRTAVSRDLRAAFEGSNRFQVMATPSAPADAQQLLDHGDVQAVITVLPGFSRDVERGDTSSVQVLVDGTNSNTASIVSSYAGQVVARFASQVMGEQQREKLVGRSMVTGGPVALGVPVIDVRTRVWFNPDLRSRNYFVPGVMVNIIMIITLMLTAMAVVREKEIGTMEQLMVTPIKPVELIIGKTLPFAICGLFDVILVTSAALLVFRIPLRGSLLLLLFCACFFLLTSVGAGLFISTISKTQQQAVMASFFFTTPAFMLSGFAFPIRNMPFAVQLLSYLDPLRYFMAAVRAVFLKGTGLETIWPQVGALAIYGAVVMAFSVMRFHKRLD